MFLENGSDKNVFKNKSREKIQIFNLDRFSNTCKTFLQNDVKLKSFYLD